MDVLDLYMSSMPAAAPIVCWVFPKQEQSHRISSSRSESFVVGSGTLLYGLTYIVAIGELFLHGLGRHWERHCLMHPGLLNEQRAKWKSMMLRPMAGC